MNSSKTLVKVVLLLTCIFTLGGSYAQEATYSQFFNNPIHYNPATIGASPGLRARLQYRDQWSAIPGQMNNYNFNMDIAERNIPGSGGFGLTVNREELGKLGLLNRTNVGLGTSVRIRLQQDFIAQIGIMGNFVQRSVGNDLYFTPDFDERFGLVGETDIDPTSNKTYTDMKFGGLLRYFGETYQGNDVITTLGMAVHHVFRPDVSFIGSGTGAPLERTYVIHGDVLIDRNGKRGHAASKSPHVKINPSFIIEAQSIEYVNLMAGVNMMRSNLYLGAWYRTTKFDSFNSNDLVMMVGVYSNVMEDVKMKLMYTYDYNLSDLPVGSTHEFTLVIELDNIFMFGSPSSNIIGGRRTTRNVAPLECSPF
jgi:type IX secretion system PorP/SprF family membrane protein